MKKSSLRFLSLFLVLGLILPQPSYALRGRQGGELAVTVSEIQAGMEEPGVQRPGREHRLQRLQQRRNWLVTVGSLLGLAVGGGFLYENFLADRTNGPQDPTSGLQADWERAAERAWKAWHDDWDEIEPNPFPTDRAVAWNKQAEEWYGKDASHIPFGLFYLKSVTVVENKLRADKEFFYATLAEAVLAVRRDPRIKVIFIQKGFDGGMPGEVGLPPHLAVISLRPGARLNATLITNGDNLIAGFDLAQPVKVKVGGKDIFLLNNKVNGKPLPNVSPKAGSEENRLLWWQVAASFLLGFSPYALGPVSAPEASAGEALVQPKAAEQGKPLVLASANAQPGDRKEAEKQVEQRLKELLEIAKSAKEGTDPERFEKLEQVRFKLQQIRQELERLPDAKRKEGLAVLSKALPTTVAEFQRIFPKISRLDRRIGEKQGDDWRNLRIQLFVGELVRAATSLVESKEVPLEEGLKSYRLVNGVLEPLVKGIEKSAALLKKPADEYDQTGLAKLVLLEGDYWVTLREAVLLRLVAGRQASFEEIKTVLEDGKKQFLLYLRVADSFSETTALPYLDELDRVHENSTITVLTRAQQMIIAPFLIIRPSSVAKTDLAPLQNYMTDLAVEATEAALARLSKKSALSYVSNIKTAESLVEIVSTVDWRKDFSKANAEKIDKLALRAYQVSLQVLKHAAADNAGSERIGTLPYLFRDFSKVTRLGLKLDGGTVPLKTERGEQGTLGSILEALIKQFRETTGKIEGARDVEDFVELSRASVEAFEIYFQLTDRVLERTLRESGPSAEGVSSVEGMVSKANEGLRSFRATVRERVRKLWSEKKLDAKDHAQIDEDFQFLGLQLLKLNNKIHKYFSAQLKEVEDPAVKGKIQTLLNRVKEFARKSYEMWTSPLDRQVKGFTGPQQFLEQEGGVAFTGFTFTSNSGETGTVLDDGLGRQLVADGFLEPGQDRVVRVVEKQSAVLSAELFSNRRIITQFELSGALLPAGVTADQVVPISPESFGQARYDLQQANVQPGDVLLLKDDLTEIEILDLLPPGVRPLIVLLSPEAQRRLKKADQIIAVVRAAQRRDGALHVFTFGEYQGTQLTATSA